jgi:hypothetical protein
VDGAVLASVVLSLAVAPRVLGRRLDPVRVAARSVSPLAALAAVTGLVYLNQVFFTVYVLREHGGDPSFIARYLPVGWFDLAGDNPLLRSLAENFPAPELLAPSVLRVQAFLELPFVLLAFATVLRWLDADLYRRVARSALLPLTALSYTAVFCAVEWDLRNPYTVGDLVIRAVSALVTPALMARMAARDSAEARQLSASGLLLFIASLGALGVLVLTVYDTALLYNLGRFADRAPIAAAAAITLTALRLTAARLLHRRPAAGPAVTFAGHALRRWMALFFVPALAVRYGVNFGTPELAALAGLLVWAAGCGHALRDTLTEPSAERTGRRLLVLSGQLGCAVLAGTATAYAAVHWTLGAYYEVALLEAMAAFLVTATAVCALTDVGLRWRFRQGARAGRRLDWVVVTAPTVRGRRAGQSSSDVRIQQEWA